MKLVELFKQVKEEKLSKDDLEDYRNQLSGLFAEMQMEIAELEKHEAIFMGHKLETQSVAEMKIAWKTTNHGLRLIELKRYCLATKEILNSLKSRLYSLY